VTVCCYTAACQQPVQRDAELTYYAVGLFNVRRGLIFHTQLVTVLGLHMSCFHINRSGAQLALDWLKDEHPELSQQQMQRCYEAAVALMWRQCM
jgi:hypothetical protein